MSQCLVCGQDATLKVEKSPDQTYCSKTCFVKASFTDLPRLPLYNVAINLDPKSLIALCQTNSRYRELCRNHNFRIEFMKKHLTLFKRYFFQQMQSDQGVLEEEWIELLVREGVFNDFEIMGILRSVGYPNAPKNYLPTFYLLYYRKIVLNSYNTINDYPPSTRLAFEKMLFLLIKNNQYEKLQKCLEVPNFDIIFEDAAVKHYVTTFRYSASNYSTFKVLIQSDKVKNAFVPYSRAYAKSIIDNETDLNDLSRLLDTLQAPVEIKYFPDAELPNLHSKIRILLEHPMLIIDPVTLLKLCLHKHVDSSVITLVLSYVKKIPDANLTFMLVELLVDPFESQDMNNLELVLQGTRGMYDMQAVVNSLDASGSFQYFSDEQKNMLARHN